MTVRTAASVSAVLRGAGIPVGYRYTQTGYVDRDRHPVHVPGCEVTRNKRSRYSGQEDAGCVRVMLIDPSRTDGEVSDAFRDRVATALRQAGLPLGRVSSLAVEVLDDEDAPTVDDEPLTSSAGVDPSAPDVDPIAAGHAADVDRTRRERDAAQAAAERADAAYNRAVDRLDAHRRAPRP